jgi:hypothetical protein
MKTTVEWLTQNDARDEDGIEEANVPPYFWATLFRRSTLALVGSQCEGIYPGEDTDYFLRVQMHGVKIRRLPCTLFAYRQFPEQASRSRKWQTVDSYLRAIEHAESVQRQLSISVARQMPIQKRFAETFTSALFWSMVGEHRDLALRAGKGVMRYKNALSIRRRLQLRLLILLSGSGWFRTAIFLAQRLYGPGIAKVGA